MSAEADAEADARPNSVHAGILLIKRFVLTAEIVVNRSIKIFWPYVFVVALYTLQLHLAYELIKNVLRAIIRGQWLLFSTPP